MTQSYITRRSAALGAMSLVACAPAQEPISVAAFPPPDDARFAAIEQRIGGRVGVAAFDTGSSAWLTHRPQERFAMCSTFKWLLAAQVLYMDEYMGGLLGRQVRFGESDLLDYAPAARANLARGWMTAEEMCEAIVVLSDNTCANKLLVVVEGPRSFNAFLRSVGDPVTRLDRMEPALNEVPPGDERDTTTPVAMVRNAQRLLLTDETLSSESREKLIGWMIECPTGRERLRAGLPADWRTGDKTGTWNGPHNAANDVAIAWPPGRAPIIIACYLRGSTVEPSLRNTAHAEIARIVAEEWR
jgi:beta-lactamase class A